MEAELLDLFFLYVVPKHLKHHLKANIVYVLLLEWYVHKAFKLSSASFFVLLSMTFFTREWEKPVLLVTFLGDFS